MRPTEAKRVCRLDEKARKGEEAARWAAAQLERLGCTCKESHHSRGCSGVYYAMYCLWLAGLRKVAPKP